MKTLISLLILFIGIKLFAEKNKEYIHFVQPTKNYDTLYVVDDSLGHFFANVFWADDIDNKPLIVFVDTTEMIVLKNKINKDLGSTVK